MGAVAVAAAVAAAVGIFLDEKDEKEIKESIKQIKIFPTTIPKMPLHIQPNLTEDDIKEIEKELDERKK